MQRHHKHYSEPTYVVVEGDLDDVVVDGVAHPLQEGEEVGGGVGGGVEEGAGLIAELLHTLAGPLQSVFRVGADYRVDV